MDQTMQCSKCRERALLFQLYSGQYLCQDHFILDVETKAKRTIRQHKGVRPGDHIAVALTGSAADDALLRFLRKLIGKRSDVRVSALPVAGTLHQSIAKYGGFTTIALSTSLEEASTWLLTRILKGQVETGCSPYLSLPTGMPVITPFCHIPQDEIGAYARLHGIGGDLDRCAEVNESLYTDTQALLEDYSRRHPAAPHAILNLCETIAHCPQENGRSRDHGA